MTVKVKGTPELTRPNGSHSLVLGYNGREFGPFDREELFPVLEVDAPRVGRVRVSFEANRYVHTGGWSEWWIFLRDIRTPATDEEPLGGREVSGIGPATREAIADACRPLVLEYLSSDAYQESRRAAAVRALVGKIDAPRGYTLDGAATLLEELETRGDIDSHQASTVRGAIRRLYEALGELELIGIYKR